MTSSRIAISPTTESLSLVEGNLKELFITEGEDIGIYLGHYPEYEVKLQKDGRDYYFNEYQKAGVETCGVRAKSDCENLIDRIWSHGSVDLSKWFCCVKDEPSFEDNYVASCDSAERSEREAEGIFN